MNSTKEQKIILAHQRLVFKLFKAWEKLVATNTKKLDPKTRWLIAGRALNAMYSRHYGTSITIGARSLAEKEASK